MPLMHMQDGTPIWVRGTFKKKDLCAFCPRFSANLCDAIIPGKPGTCDKPMCAECSTQVGFNRHHCPNHRGHAPEQGMLALMQVHEGGR